MFSWLSSGKKKLMHFDFRFQDYDNVVCLCSSLWKLPSVGYESEDSWVASSQSFAVAGAFVLSLSWKLKTTLWLLLHPNDLLASLAFWRKCQPEGTTRDILEANKADSVYCGVWNQIDLDSNTGSAT